LQRVELAGAAQHQLTLALTVGQRGGDDMQVGGLVLGLAEREQAARLAGWFIGEHLAMRREQPRHRQAVDAEIGPDVEHGHARL
jgi:hypothetical protein